MSLRTPFAILLAAGIVFLSGPQRMDAEPSWIVGGDMPPDDCNGISLIDTKCGVNQTGQSCGTDYKEINKALSGGWNDKRYEIDKNWCNTYPSCTVQTWKKLKESETPCTKKKTP